MASPLFVCRSPRLRYPYGPPKTTPPRAMPLAVSALHIYPVKGLKGVDLDEARLTERGLEHDRRWMVVDAAGEFLSQRVLPRMATVWTAIEDGALELSAPDMA